MSAADEMTSGEACFAYEDWTTSPHQYDELQVLEDMARERAALAAFDEALDALMATVPPIAHIGDGQGGACLALIWKAFLPYRTDESESRRTRKSAKTKIPQALRTQVFERDAYRCVKCGSHLHLQCDHIHPESKGGPTAEWNLQTLCRSCNASKGAKVE